MKMNVLTSVLFMALLVSCKGVQMPVMGESAVYDVDVEELSGLCLNPQGTALLSCGDQGVVKQISFTGEVSDFRTHDADMEGITVDPATEDIYLAIEGEQKVCRMEAPDYKDYPSAFYVQEAVDNEYRNSGLEGISYYKDGIVFIGSQREANLWQYKVNGTLVSSISLSGFASEIAALCYDEAADCLWVADSKLAKIFVCTVDGQLIDTYDFPFIENAEALCVDRDRNCLWIGSDEDATKLYKVDFDSI